jgi:adenine-specific DNA-methyltransferase
MLKLSPRQKEGAALTPIVDRLLVLELSASLAQENRLGFARSFSAAIAMDYIGADAWSAGVKKPPDVDERRLSDDARETAQRIALGMQSLQAAEVAYAIGSLYAMLLPESFRAQHGIFYTPPSLVENLLGMAEAAGIDWRVARALDPSCGGGAFLVGIALRMAKALEAADPAITLQSIAGRLRGFDIDPFGAWLASVAVAGALRPLIRAAGRPMPNLGEARDSLELRSEEVGSFDLVVGNPPYGRVTLPQERRQRFSRSIYGHANLYGVFTEAALHWLKPAGVVGYVTPTSMLSGLYYKSLRALLAEDAPPLAVTFISERDGVFADVLQETMLATYRKAGFALACDVGFIDPGGEKQKTASGKAGTFRLPAEACAPWLLPRSPAQAGLARRLWAMPHRLSNYGYGVSTGPLVWNRFKDQFRTKAGGDTFPVIWAEAVTRDGRFLWRSEKRNHAPWFAARRPKDDWLIVTRPCVLLQRTTAKEQPRRLIAAELPASFIRKHKGVAVENHLNMVRATGSEPAVPASVIAALLNSAAVDAAFRCLNGSVAVSAFELEALPLPAPAAMAKLTRLIEQGAATGRIEAVIAAAYGKSNAAAAA